MSNIFRVLVLVALVGCNQLRDGARDVAGDLIDCTVADIQAHVVEYGPAIEAALRAAISADGHVDQAKLAELAKGFGLRSGGCVLASMIQRWLAMPPTMGLTASRAQPDQSGLRAAFKALYPGKHFNTAYGEI